MKYTPELHFQTKLAQIEEFYKGSIEVLLKSENRLKEANTELIELCKAQHKEINQLKQRNPLITAMKWVFSKMKGKS